MPQNQKLPSLESLKHVHIIGVCGTLMGSFAAFLKRRGMRVTGSDQNVYPPMSDVLREAGVELMEGFLPENLLRAGRPDLVVIGNVVRAVNPEARAAIDGGLVYSSLPEAMEHLFLPQTRNLVVAGTHGKTTTSSLLAHVLTQAGKDPNYFIGGVATDLPSSFHVPDISAGHLFVLEGDEYDTAFWDKVPKFNHYLPDDVILTSVEYDHADIYPNFEAVMKAFEGLMSRIRPGGRLIACADYESVRTLATRATVNCLTYGSQPGDGIRFAPGRIVDASGVTTFEVLDQGKSVAKLTIAIPGHHNVMNALAVWIECRELGLAPEIVRAGLASFRGVKRRQEVRGEPRGILVIDDFAHHPTAVRETLGALRSRYPGRRLVAVFEPRSATSRRKVFQKDYAEAFQKSDAAFIAAPHNQAEIVSDDQFSSQTLVADIARGGAQGFLMPTVEEGVAAVAKYARPGDLVAVLSNGGFGGFIPKLLKSLE